ncbi:MAG: hypothetical protein ACRERD_29405 [Candidatus Binatia bacterium]
MKPDKPHSELLEGGHASALTTDPSTAWTAVFQSLGLPPYHVRIEDGMVCIEAPPEDFTRLLDPAVRPVLVAHGKALGYLFVTLDLN